MVMASADIFIFSLLLQAVILQIIYGVFLTEKHITNRDGKKHLTMYILPQTLHAPLRFLIKVKQKRYLIRML